MSRSRKQAAAAIIQSNSFYGQKELSTEQLETLRFNSSTDALEQLIEWNGGLIALIGLHLSNDNAKITSSELFLAGCFFENTTKVLAAQRFFADAPQAAKLVLHEIDASMFKFDDALTSNYIDSSALRFEFKDSLNGPSLSPQELSDRGFSGFCVRAHVYPVEELYVKAHLSLFPLSAGELQEQHPTSHLPGFPGFSVFHCCFPLGPAQTDVFEQADWGQPLLPCLLSDEAFAEDDPAPSSRDLRAAVGTLLRSACSPNNKKSPTFLAAAWKKISEEGETAISPPALQLVWPPPRAPMEHTQGRKKFSFRYVRLYITNPPPPLPSFLGFLLYLYPPPGCVSSPKKLKNFFSLL